MLKIKGNYFILETKNTSLVIKSQETFAEYLYYGPKLSDYTGLELLAPEDYGWTAPRLVFAQWGYNDFREPSVHVRFQDGSDKTDFRFHKGKIVARETPKELPYSYGEDKCLKLEFVDATAKLKLTLCYTAYYDSDVITSYATLHNSAKKSVYIENLASLCFETWGKDFNFITFDGAWGSERQKHVRPIGTLGKCVNESFTGSSSPMHNPFVMLERTGEVYAFNLVYSGNHREVCDGDEYNRTRMITGINPFSFNWELAPAQDFNTPEAVMAYAPTQEEVSLRMHRFVSEHIIRGKWKKKERPVLVNNWEGTYFDFTKDKILAIAQTAANVGAELFVLDDGWFGKRDDDFRSLGDWVDHVEKTGGIDKLADSIRAMGLKFGIWVEPEMVNEDSDLYRKHPEYAMKIPRREPTRMRNQIMLNLADPQVQGYVYRAIARVIETCKAQYIKWDYNRHMTDCYDRSTRGGEYYHRYIMGLYAVLEKLTARFPNVLFESCASGGCRFDLGMLCYMPQTWTSDNSDARERIAIQSGTAHAYPQNTMGAHVSACPNHQTGNTNSLEARFRVACGGVLGYECDLTKMTEEELAQITEQIEFYKKYRTALQFGEYHRLGNAFGGEVCGYISVAQNQETAVAVVTVLHKRTGIFNYRMAFTGLDDNAQYRVLERGAKGGLKEICVASGSLLNRGAIRLQDILSETDARENSNPIYTKMYVFERVSGKKSR